MERKQKSNSNVGRPKQFNSSVCGDTGDCWPLFESKPNLFTEAKEKSETPRSC